MARQRFENAVTEFGQAVSLLVRRVRAAGGSHDLSWTEAAVMARLARDGPATTADLARAEGMRPQSMGATVAALEEMGMVHRTPHPSDGRQLNIELTAKGAAVRKGVGDAKRSWLIQAVARLDDKERDTLFAAGHIIRQLLDA